MLIEFKDSQILVDNKPFIEDLRINVDPTQKLVRLKTKYVISCDEHKPVDLALAYTTPQISLPLASIEITGRELIRNIYFKVTLGFHLLKMKFRVTGNFGGKRIDQEISGIVDLLNVIKSGI